MRMQKMDFYGRTVTYANITDLPQRIQEALKEVRLERETLEKQFDGLKAQERQMAKFLGISMSEISLKNRASSEE